MAEEGLKKRQAEYAAIASELAQIELRLENKEAELRVRFGLPDQE